MSEEKSWLDRTSNEQTDMLIPNTELRGTWLALLVTGSEKNEIVEFRFGGVVCLERRDDKKWKVAWMVTPSLLHG
jgi:phosphohistidine phosphatase SixA